MMDGRDRPVRLVRFGAFEVDLQSQELRKGGTRIRLTGKPFQLLARLLEIPGEIVLRDELRDYLWSADTFVDFEHGLNATVNRLRAALGDSARSPHFVETLPRRGYRFVYPVELPNSRLSQPDRIMVAVLPFENATGDPSQDYFSDGFTEELLTRLGGLDPHQIAVIARTSVSTYKGRAKDVRIIGSELGVEFVVEGSVRRDGERVCATARLVSTSDQSCLWGETFEQPLANIGELQRSIVETLACCLNVPPSEPAVASRPFCPESLEASLRALNALNQRTPASVRQAIDLFQTAARLEPDMVAAHDGCAQAYALAVDYGVMGALEGCALARKEGTRALSLDPSSARARTVLAYVRHRFEWDWVGAEEEYRKALQCNSSEVTAHHGYAEFLSQMGRHDEALNQIGAARRVDPVSRAVLAIEGWLLYHAGRLDEATERCQETLRKHGDFALARYVAGRVLLRTGRVKEALAELRQAVIQSEDNPFILAGFGYALGLAGRRRNAKETLRVLERRTDRPFVSPYLKAKVHLGLGDHNRALECLEEGVRQRSGWLVDLLVDPEIDPLRDDPRFHPLMASLNFPQQNGPTDRGSSPAGFPRALAPPDEPHTPKPR